MYGFTRSTKFRRDIRRCQRQQKDMDKFKEIHELLVMGKPLPARNKDHLLTGNWRNHRECHVEPDWLLIYRINDDKYIIEYVRTGSHSDLFNT
jgi:mRNA interferase YafQ